MTDLGGEIERYRITRLEGFVSQSSEAWVTRDPVGEVRQVYIPGVFEAIRSPGTARWTASVSIAASANDPFEAPIYKGCLGARSIAMSGAPDDLAEVRERAPRFRGAEPFAPSRNATPIALPRAEPVRVSSGGGSSPNVTGFASSWLVATGDAPLEPQRGAPLPPLPNADGLSPLSPPLPPLSPPDITWTDDPPPGGGGDVPPLPDMPRPSSVPLPIGVTLLLPALGLLVLMRRRA
jgi:hypothetical protein